MIEVINNGSSNVFGMTISGKLLHRDYQQFVPRLEKLSSRSMAPSGA